MFTPYFNDSLNENIQTQEEDDAIARVMRMDDDGLRLFHCDLKTEEAIRPGFKHTRYCELLCKAIIRRNQELEHQASKPKYGFLDFFGAVQEFMFGWIVADEFFKRTSGK